MGAKIAVRLWIRLDSLLVGEDKEERKDKIHYLWQPGVEYDCNVLNCCRPTRFNRAWIYRLAVSLQSLVFSSMEQVQSLVLQSGCRRQKPIEFPAAPSLQS